MEGMLISIAVLWIGFSLIALAAGDKKPTNRRVK